ncbi:hypothetical protein CPB85DRAFT_1356184 [Mucidula mucida]|nr:hypothetical protein CPB85DRAFT_1356184 [Mucidula mucida]
MADSTNQPQTITMCKMCNVRHVYVSNGVPFEFCSRSCGMAFRNQQSYSAQSLGRSSFFNPAPANHYRKSAPPFFGSSPGRPVILFYNKNQSHYSFTNFAEYPVVYNGERYPTSEHLFQSFKFEHIPDLVRNIRLLPTPRQAFDEARKHNQDKRRDWDLVKVGKMEEIVYLKFTQHPALKTELLATGNAQLVEDSPYDSFWGIGGNGTGRNELGKALMKVRDRLLAGN